MDCAEARMQPPPPPLAWIASALRRSSARFWGTGGRDGRGRVTAVKGSVVAGFLRRSRFYTREQAAAASV
jgi:hypothetical protein